MGDGSLFIFQSSAFESLKLIFALIVACEHTFQFMVSDAYAPVNERWIRYRDDVMGYLILVMCFAYWFGLSSGNGRYSDSQL